MTLTRQAGVLRAEPSKTSLVNELKNPVFVATQLLTVLTAVAWVFTYFHVGPAATGVVTHLRSEVTILAPILVFGFQALYALHHFGIKKLETELVKIERLAVANPTAAFGQFQAVASSPVVKDVEAVIKDGI